MAMGTHYSATFVERARRKPEPRYVDIAEDRGIPPADPKELQNDGDPIRAAALPSFLIQDKRNDE